MYTFAEYLRHQRLSRGLTMQTLASHLGISPQFISLLESGHRRPSQKLLRRCAEFFNDDVNYLNFLAQPIPEAQRRALYESPVAPEYIPRPLRAQVLAQDSEDLLLQNLFALPGLPDPLEDTPYFATDMPEFPTSAAAVALEVIQQLKTERHRYSLKAQAWARFYEAFYKRAQRGRREAAPDFEALREWMRIESAGTYSSKIRYLLALHLGLIRQEQERFSEARAFFEEARGYATEMSDSGAEASVCWSIAQTYRAEGDLFQMLEWLDTALRIENLPPFAIARCQTDRLEILQLLRRDTEVLQAVENVSVLWRSASLKAPQALKSRLLFHCELCGLETCFKMGDEEGARIWLNRTRAIASRIPVSPFDKARIEEGAAWLVFERGRPRHARGKLEELLRQYFPEDDAGRTIRDEIRFLLIRVYLHLGDVNKAEALLVEMGHEPPLRTTLREIHRRMSLALAQVDFQLATDSIETVRETLQSAERTLNQILVDEPRLEGTPLVTLFRGALQARRDRVSV